MKTLICVMAMASSVPVDAYAQAPKTKPASKPRVICRAFAGQAPRATVKVCHTQDDWIAIDRADERQSQSYLRGRDRPGI